MEKLYWELVMCIINYTLGKTALETVQLRCRWKAEMYSY